MLDPQFENPRCFARARLEPTLKIRRLEGVSLQSMMKTPAVLKGHGFSRAESDLHPPWLEPPRESPPIAQLFRPLIGRNSDHTGLPERTEKATLPAQPSLLPKIPIFQLGSYATGPAPFMTASSSSVGLCERLRSPLEPTRPSRKRAVGAQYTSLGRSHASEPVRLA
jgi:hypothetical protein